MKIAAALGVWPFWGWKIINHGGWFTQVKGRSWQKKAFLTVSFMPAWTGYSSWLQNYIAPSVHTSLLQHFYNTPSACTSLLQHFYIIYTSLLHHSFSSYVTFTSVPSSVPFVHPPPFLNVLKTVFPAVPATPHGHAINCVPVHRFRVGRTTETGLTPAEWREFPRYALARILMHAVKTEPARFWRVFGWFVACFTGFPSETPSEALRRCTQWGVMVNRCLFLLWSLCD